MMLLISLLTVKGQQIVTETEKTAGGGRKSRNGSLLLIRKKCLTTP